MKKRDALVTILIVLLFFLGTLEINPCTAFLVSRNGKILAGNNEDWRDPKTKMWFVPAENGKYGRVYFGFGNFWPQGGMNDQGLFFDGFATQPFPLKKSADKPSYQGNLIDKAMSECSTVKEVISLFGKYNLQFLERAMLMFGDATGQSVIIEGDEFVLKNRDYQIVTNFYQSTMKPEEYTCWRYLKADSMLNSTTGISVDICRDILDAVHQDLTQYSNIYDLKNRIVYLYHYHDFDNVVVIDLIEELKKGKQIYDIPSLFPEKKNTPSMVLSAIGQFLRFSIIFFHS